METFDVNAQYLQQPNQPATGPNTKRKRAQLQEMY